jgi:hypothetical protein
VRTYIAFYRGKKIEVIAATSLAAQAEAARIFKARKAYEIAVVLADTSISTASL